MKSLIKTIPGSLIAQGLSGLNDAKIQTFFEIASAHMKKRSYFHNFVTYFNNMIHAVQQ